MQYECRGDRGSQTITILVGYVFRTNAWRRFIPNIILAYVSSARNRYHHRSEVALRTMLREFLNAGCALHVRLHEIEGVVSPDAGEMTNGSKSEPDATGQFTQVLACQIR